jgi:hypothetical protein
MGVSGSLGFWEPLVAPFAERHRVIAFDSRGLYRRSPYRAKSAKR